MTTDTDHILKLAKIIREVDGGNRLGAAALAEAILSHPGSKWSPAVEPEPEDKVLARVEFAKRDFNGPSDVILAKYCDDWFYGDPNRTEIDLVDLCRGAIKLFAQTPAPIPVNERLPAEADCDAEGNCWFWHPYHKEDSFTEGWMLLSLKWADVLHDSDDSPVYTHWLPHYALPIPTPTTETP